MKKAKSILLIILCIPVLAVLIVVWSVSNNQQIPASDNETIARMEEECKSHRGMVEDIFADAEKNCLAKMKSKIDYQS
jgi:hypothetical protein